MISKLANDINSSLLEGYDPFTFSEGLDQRKSTQIRFEHLEFCVRIMDTGEFISFILIVQGDK